jgi:uncharacterized membrane protein YkoI
MNLLHRASLAIAITAASLGLTQPALAGLTDQIAALRIAKLDLAQAIAAVEGQHGLKVIDIELDHERQQAVYEVKGVDAQNQKVKLKINAADGQIVERKPDGKLGGKDGRRLAGAKIGIADAVAAALKHEPGQAVEAELDEHLGQVSYHVKVLGDANRETKVRVSAADGSIMPLHPNAQR